MTRETGEFAQEFVQIRFSQKTQNICFFAKNYKIIHFCVFFPKKYEINSFFCVFPKKIRNNSFFCVFPVKKQFFPKSTTATTTTTKSNKI